MRYEERYKDNKQNKEERSKQGFDIILSLKITHQGT